MRMMRRKVAHPEASPPKIEVKKWDAYEIVSDMVLQWAMSLGDNQTMIYRIHPRARAEFTQKVVDVCGLKAYQENPGPVVMYRE
jgi:hypothetical protein